MIDKPLNQLNAFFNLTQERTICGSDQLLYLHLFNRFNRAHWAQSISIPDRELIAAMRLYESTGKPAGVNTLYRSRSRLKSAGLIDFQTGKGANCTKYELKRLYPVDTPSDTPSDTPVDTPVDTSTPLLINNAREDIKIKEVKTNLNTTAKAGAREGFLKETSPLVVETWLKYEGERLNGGQMLDLYNLEKLYGSSAVVKAIIEASRSNKYQRLTYNFVKKVLENQQRGGTKNAGIIDNSQYATIDTF